MGYSSTAPSKLLLYYIFWKVFFNFKKWKFKELLMKYLKTCPKCHSNLKLHSDVEIQYCSICGYWTKIGTARLDSIMIYGWEVCMNKELQLKDREWKRLDCKTKHDRDINAAINIKKFAFIDQKLIRLWHIRNLGTCSQKRKGWTKKPLSQRLSCSSPNLIIWICLPLLFC